MAMDDCRRTYILSPDKLLGMDSDWGASLVLFVLTIIQVKPRLPLLC